jgi:hypothetical protein
MKGAAALIAALLLPAALAAQGAGPGAPAAPDRTGCHLTAEDLAANARLSFEDFDQAGVTPATARKLGERGCYSEAARASEHYLIHGPVLDDYQRNVVRWHLGQYLASSGNEEAAAKVIASTRRPADPARPDFDWNSYVTGTWAFLVRDRALLQESWEKLRTEPTRENGMNARVLARLLKCFDQSYREAYEGPACGAPDQER